MKRAWDWAIHAITKDDLFWRVLFLLLGTGVGSLGIWAFGWLVSSDSNGESVGFLILAWAFAVFFSLWGVLLFVRCWVPSRSTLARLAEKFMPDSADEGALILLIVFALPAVLLTFALRLLGVRGTDDVRR
jgi:hypothetical protein